MQVAGREIGGTTILAVLAGIAGLVGTAVLGWDFGDGLNSPAAVAIGVVIAVVAVWVSYTRP